MTCQIVTQNSVAGPAFHIGQTATMSSREIADLAGARHNDVVATIDRLFYKGLLRSSRVTRPEATGGRPTTVYDLVERDVYVVISGYSDEVRARIIDRWQELEQANAPTIPKSYAAALRLAAEQADRIEQQQAQLTAAAPKVDFVDRYATAHGSKSFREVCKLLGANEAHFRLFLIEDRVAYRLGGVLTPHQNHIDAGRFEVKTGISAANEHAFNQMRFTPKGITWAAGEWAKYRLRRQEEAA